MHLFSKPVEETTEERAERLADSGLAAFNTARDNLLESAALRTQAATDAAGIAEHYRQMAIEEQERVNANKAEANKLTETATRIAALIGE